MIKIYDTKLRQKVEFQPKEPGKISMYVCGPTVYNRIHIGNARTFISFDVIRRYLIWRGFDVTFVQNVTDVDDKIIKRAGEEGRSAAEVAAEYTQAFIDDMHAAGVLDPDVRPRATGEIPDMIALVQELVDGGHAYEVEGDVYFSVCVSLFEARRERGCARRAFRPQHRRDGVGPPRASRRWPGP